MRCPTSVHPLSSTPELFTSAFGATFSRRPPRQPPDFPLLRVFGLRNVKWTTRQEVPLIFPGRGLGPALGSGLAATGGRWDALFGTFSTGRCPLSRRRGGERGSERQTRSDSGILGAAPVLGSTGGACSAQAEQLFYTLRGPAPGSLERPHPRASRLGHLPREAGPKFQRPRAGREGLFPARGPGSCG